MCLGRSSPGKFVDGMLSLARLQSQIMSASIARSPQVSNSSPAKIALISSGILQLNLAWKMKQSSARWQLPMTAVILSISNEGFSSSGTGISRILIALEKRQK